jgi:cytochrome c oxidase subunit 3
LPDSTTTTATGAYAARSLHRHFADMEQQRETATLGMWLFLVTEIMFFGGMFAAYLIYRTSYFAAWRAGSEHMNFWYGTINTIVLICSSLTVALAVHAAQLGNRKTLVWLLIATILFGGVFMGIKVVEYHEHWVRHEFPGPTFHFDGPDPRHVELFFWLYFVMTGFHALHLLIGIGVMVVIATFAWLGHYGPEYHNPVEIAGLYWHFVDVVWIYLYPLLYLISHHHQS